MKSGGTEKLIFGFAKLKRVAIPEIGNFKNGSLANKKRGIEVKARIELGWPYKKKPLREKNFKKIFFVCNMQTINNTPSVAGRNENSSHLAHI